MKSVLFPLCLLAACVASASAEGLPSFGFTDFSAFKAAQASAAVPHAQASDEITTYHMIAQAGRDTLIGYADTAAQAAEATAYWSGILKAAGIKVGAPAFADGMYQIPYKTVDGRVIRDFLAEPRQFPPKDEAGLRANMAMIKGALAKDGLTVVASHLVTVDALLPTYSILYLTKPGDAPEHETRLRVLKPGDDLEFDVFRAAGVDVVQTPEAWMMVYVGPEVGYVGMAAQTAADMDAKVAKRREFLLGENKKIFAERRFPIDDPDYKFGAALYFFQ